MRNQNVSAKPTGQYPLVGKSLEVKTEVLQTSVLLLLIKIVFAVYRESGHTVSEINPLPIWI